MQGTPDVYWHQCYFVPYECRYEGRAARRRSCCIQAYFPSGAVRRVTVRCPQLASRRWYIRALAGEARRGEPGAIFCSFRANLASTLLAIITDITLGLGGVPLIIQVGTPGIQCLRLKLKLKPLLVTDTRVAVSRCIVSESLKATSRLGTPYKVPVLAALTAASSLSHQDVGASSVPARLVR